MYGLGQFPPGVLLPGLEAAWEYLKAKVRTFDGLGPRLTAMHAQAAEIARLHRDAGNLAEFERARRLVEGIGRTRLEWGETRQRIEDIRQKVPGGLGALPVAVIVIGAAVIAASAAVAAVFLSTSEQEQELDLLAAGVVTTAELERMRRARTPGIFGGLADTAKYVVLGIGAYFLLPALLKGVRRGS